MNSFRARLSRWSKIFLIALFVMTPVLVIVAGLLDSFSVGGLGGAIALAITFSIMSTLVYPLTFRLSFRFRPVIYLLITFLLAILAFRLSVFIVEELGFTDVRVGGNWTVVAVVACLLLAQSFAEAIRASSDDLGYYDAIAKGLGQNQKAVEPASEPGILFLEIDGLALPILREAMAQGRTPTLKRWLEDGSHTLSAWEPDLSSQTSASQAGILLGSNHDIPAFRWWDKASGKAMVSSGSDTAELLEARLSDGHGLLVGGGSRWNVFSGDATNAIATFSTVRHRDLLTTAGSMAYVSNPIALSRTSGLFLAEIVRELWQAWRQRRQNIEPRIHRGAKYSLVRAATTTSMQEASFFMLISDMMAGIPVVYNTFFAYDEVAHHSGPHSQDAIKVLGKLDEGFARLESAASYANRPYRFVVLSDHGQSQGLPFEKRYGTSLRDLVLELIGRDVTFVEFEDRSESMGNIQIAIEQLLARDSRKARVAQMVGVGAGASDSDDIALESTSDQDIAVMASGNLGLISFTSVPTRVPLEEIESDLPGLIDGLARHPGIGFVMVHAREDDEAVVIGPRGRRYLREDRLIGEDPLSVYGPTARAHLLRTDSFSNAPDILVMSRFNPVTGETSAFEDLVGNHGGLGGPQQEPFVLHPVDFPYPTETVVGAATLHQILKSWVRNSQPGRFVSPPNGPVAIPVTPGNATEQSPGSLSATLDR